MGVPCLCANGMIGLALGIAVQFIALLVKRICPKVPAAGVPTAFQLTRRAQFCKLEVAVLFFFKLEHGNLALALRDTA